MATEVVINPISIILPYIALAVGLTAITFIALVLFLDLEPDSEPVELPVR